MSKLLWSGDTIAISMSCYGFKDDFGVDSKEEKADIEDDPDEGGMEDV